MNRSAKVMIARFPGNNSEHPASSQWVIDVATRMAKDPRISEVIHWVKSDTPITMVRNEAMKYAKSEKVDVLVMIDSDMNPDHISAEVRSERPFWDSSFDYYWKHYDRGPMLIAAPYVGPAPYELPYIFHWKNRESGHPNPDWQLEMFSREQASERTGFEEVPALPTGLILIDMRVIEPMQYKGRMVTLPPPYFYYAFTDKFETHKAMTEDVAFTRDCHLLGVHVLVNWDAWACHVKLKHCGKPQILPSNIVGDSYLRALTNLAGDESVVMLGDSPCPRPDKKPEKQIVNPKEPPTLPAEEDVEHVCVPPKKTRRVKLKLRKRA